jgi:hypothetical protein
MPVATRHDKDRPGTDSRDLATFVGEYFETLPSTTCRSTSRREVASGKMRALADGALVLREEVGAGSVATSQPVPGMDPGDPVPSSTSCRLQMD